MASNDVLPANTDRIDHLYQDPHEEDVRLTLHYGDLVDSTNLIRTVQEVQPMSYNPPQCHVQVSFETPEYTANADALGTLRLPKRSAFGHAGQGEVLSAST